MVQKTMTNEKKFIKISSPKKTDISYFFRLFYNRFSIIEKYLTVFAILIMASLVFIQIILRSFFFVSHAGMEEFARILMLWSGMMGCAIATRRKFHVTCDILTLIVSNEKTIRFIGIFMELICVMCSVVFTFWSYSYLSSGIFFNKVTRDLMIPTYWVDSAFLVSGILMVIYFSIHFVSDCIQLKNFISAEKIKTSKDPIRISTITRKKSN